MPASRRFSKDARVAKPQYLLGLDRDPEDDLRSPRVVFGDPALSAELEALNRLDNTSTNLVLSFVEWLSDHEAELIGRGYVENLLMAGVPRNHYTYFLVIHDEAVEGIEGEKPVAGAARRTAIHPKIENLLLPSGSHLQPYWKRDEMFTTLFLSDLAIKRRFADPLERDRVRNAPKHHRHGAIAAIKRKVDTAVRNASRLANGRPDHEAIKKVLRGLGFEEVFAARGRHGRRGIYLKLDDHPRPIRFFGTGFEELHNHIIETEGKTNEHSNSPKFAAGEEFFPDGYLDRGERSAAKIASALSSYRSARASYNVRKYALHTPTVVFGGLTVGVPPGPFRGLGGPDDMALDGERRPKDPAGVQGTNVDLQPEPSNISAEIAKNKPSNQIPHEHTGPGKTAAAEWHPDVRGTHTSIPSSIAAVVAELARLIRAAFDAAADLQGAIREGNERRAQSAQALVEVARNLDLADIGLGEAARRLGDAVERRTTKGTAMISSQAVCDENGHDPYEFIQIVSRPLPSPKIGPKLSIEPQ